MSSPAQRYAQAVRQMETAALQLLRYAERFKDNIQNTSDRVNRSEEMFEAARRYAAAARKLARLRA